jgi:GNAT superfamily N-acetyltransferase
MFHVDEEVFESVGQLAGMWGKLVEDVGGHVGDEKGLAVRWADSDFGFHNALVANDRVSGTEQLRELLSRAVKFMDRKSKPGFLWIFEELVSPDARAKLGELASASGLSASLTCWGMAGELTSMQEPAHRALRFERVTRDEHLDMYATLNANAYGLPDAGARAAFHGSHLWCEDIFAYIAFEEARPVACAGACEVDGRLFVLLVATEPSRHRRGFGEAVTRKALFEASRATGVTRACLQATAAGKPVYEKIGFRQNSTLQLFSRDAE